MLKAEMFNEKAAKKNNKPDKIIDIIGIKKGQSVADIGSGGGYFSFRFAEIIGNTGRVYAVDINTDFLKFIKETSEKKGLLNIITKDKLNIPEQSLDFIFMRNVTHHIQNRTSYFANMKKFLKSSGKFIIIDYNKGAFYFLHSPVGHALKKETILMEMNNAGYILKKDLDILKTQFFFIFSV